MESFNLQQYLDDIYQQYPEGDWKPLIGITSNYEGMDATLRYAYYNKVIGSYPNWEFIDTQDPQEILRRKNIINQLVSALNNAKIKEPEQKAEQ